MCHLAVVIATCMALMHLAAAVPACKTRGGPCICSSAKVNCNRLNLATVPDDIPTSPPYLTLQNNRITELQPGKFQTLKSLTILHLNNNQITIIKSRTFVGLQMLQELRLNWNNISVVEPGSFQHLTELTFLNLGYNKLTTLPRYTFAASSKLSRLLLHNNSITTLPYDIFEGCDPRLYLTVNPNPWFCDCHMKDVWRFSDWANRVSCQSPPALKGQRLRSLSANDLRCSSSSPAATSPVIAVITSSVHTPSFEVEDSGNGSIIYIVVGSFVCGFVLCTVAGVVYCMHKRKQTQQDAEDPSRDVEQNEGENDDDYVPDSETGEDSSPQYQNILPEDEHGYLVPVDEIAMPGGHDGSRYGGSGEENRPQAEASSNAERGEENTHAYQGLLLDKRYHVYTSLYHDDKSDDEQHDYLSLI
ncbi:hypothetical protein Bbelb_269040 [Branchiostoma belcheri]|nr:hypothetical protein Bbelb_269040 [Branchiostoma belcheri]